MLGCGESHLQLAGPPFGKQASNASLLLTFSRREFKGKESSGGPVEPDGMMCHVFVKVRQNQQQLEHAIALFRIRIACSLFEILDHRQSVRQQPLDVARAHRFPLAAPRKHVVRAQERFVQKVIEAQPLGR
jgi:hypothetical protein